MNELAGVLEETIAAGAEKLGIDLDPACLGAFRVFYQAMVEENEKHNLTAIRGEREVAVKHFIDSLSCLKVIDIDAGPVVDLGSGAGFPGIPLKIKSPQMKILLVDSVRKKANFISEVINKLCLEEAEARWDRAEAMGGSGEFRERAGIVISRAVASLSVLAELCLPLVNMGGCFLAMKGPGWREELDGAGKAINLMGGRVERLETLTLPFIPEERALVLIRKESPTPAGYPRRPGIPARRPIA